MPAEMINLRQVRKTKARAVRDQQAAENRAIHGRTRAERQRQDAEADLAARRLDQLRRDEPTT